ncbi:MAG TPA: APC family permease [Thermoanaerobaculia bacterium]|nr:APC family permease [Thermoanaerobaculia bacterium]
MPLEKTLRTRDLVLFNVAAIVGMRWIALAAHSGPSSLGLWVLAALVFFIPQGLAVTALSSAIPEEGGLYVWTTRAFGPRHGFLCGWLYWAANITYIPTLGMSTVVFALYTFNLRYAHLEKSTAYTATAALVLLAIALALNIIGLRTGKWVQNIGGLAQWLPTAALLLVGVVALARDGSATAFPARSFLPSFSDFDTISFFALICFGFAGLELAPMCAGEVVDPKRTFPRAIVISGITIAACYGLGTVSLLWALRPADVSIIAGVNQAIAAAGARHGMAWLGPPIAVLMTLAGLGGMGAWLIGTARLLFVGGLDRYLPPVFGRLHPRWKTPHVALLVQAGLSALFILASAAGSTIKEAYLVLVEATLITYFIPYLYMFAAAIRLRREIASSPGAISVPGRKAGSWISNGVGFATTLLAIGLALVPPSGTKNKMAFFAKVFVESFGFVGIGYVLYVLAERRRTVAGARSGTGSA